MREHLLWEVAHLIIEVEKSHHTLSAKQRTRKNCGIIQSKFKSLKTRGVDDMASSSKLKT